MKKSISFWSIIILIILNILSVSMLWINFGRQPDKLLPARPGRQEQKTLRFLQKELDLTDAQIQQYDRLRKAHAQQTQPLIHDIHRLKKEMMDNILDGSPDSAKLAEVAYLIGSKQSEIERLTFLHFLDLKKLCGEEKLDKLQGLLNEFFRRNPPPGQQAPLRPRNNDRLFNNHREPNVEH